MSSSIQRTLLYIYLWLLKNKYYIIVFLECLCLLIIIFYIKARITKRIQPKPNLASIDSTHFQTVCDASVLKFYCEPKPNSFWSYGMQPGTGTKINSDGINSVREYSLEKDRGTFRILSIGDSHTFGMYVDNFHNYPEILEDLLNSGGRCNQYDKYDVINLGFWGDDIKYSIYRYQKKGIKYNPDLVIWYVKRDDFEEIKDDVETLVSACQDKIQINDQVAASNCVDSAYKEYYSTANLNLNKKENFNVLADFVKHYKGKLLFFTYSDEEPDIIKFLELLSSKNIYLVDNLKYNQISRFGDGHPDATGYRLIAADLKKYISENILNCH